VFTFDTFFVTSVENYDANGVLFKGNLRGKAAESQSKLKSRLQVCHPPSLSGPIVRCTFFLLFFMRGPPR
jgi:hypothetical protein